LLRQNRSKRRPSAALGEQSPDHVRAPDHLENVATGHVDVATDADRPGPSKLGDRGHVPPRANSGQMPFVDSIRRASSPTPLPTSDTLRSP
jgi:hypothetical protein